MNARNLRELEKWDDLPCLAFDIESTGVNAHEDRVVTATLVEFQPGKRPVATNWLVNPGIEIPAEATAVHGVTTEHARAHGVSPDQALFELSGRIALWLGHRRPVVAFNAAYDLTMIEAENRRNNIPTLAERLAPKGIGPVIDPMVIDRHVDPYRKKACACGCGATNKTLGGCCTHYRVPLVAAHTSESDAASAVRLFRAIVHAHPDAFLGMLLPGLHEAQKGWRREQQISLRRYFDRQGIAHDGMDPGWPVMSTPVAPVQDSIEGVA